MAVFQRISAKAAVSSTIIIDSFLEEMCDGPFEFITAYFFRTCDLLPSPSPPSPSANSPVHLQEKVGVDSASSTAALKGIQAVTLTALKRYRHCQAPGTTSSEYDLLTQPPHLTSFPTLHSSDCSSSLAHRTVKSGAITCRSLHQHSAHHRDTLIDAPPFHSSVDNPSGVPTQRLHHLLFVPVTRERTEADCSPTGVVCGAVVAGALALTLPAFAAGKQRLLQLIGLLAEFVTDARVAAIHRQLDQPSSPPIGCDRYSEAFDTKALSHVSATEVNSQPNREAEPNSHPPHTGNVETSSHIGSPPAASSEPYKLPTAPSRVPSVSSQRSSLSRSSLARGVGILGGFGAVPTTDVNVEFLKTVGMLTEEKQIDKVIQLLISAVKAGVRPQGLSIFLVSRDRTQLECQASSFRVRGETHSCSVSVSIPPAQCFSNGGRLLITDGNPSSACVGLMSSRDVIAIIECRLGKRTGSDNVTVSKNPECRSMFRSPVHVSATCSYIRHTHNTHTNTRTHTHTHAHIHTLMYLFYCVLS